MIQQLEQQLSINGDEIITEFDCPVVESTNRLLLVPPTSIMGAVSVVHLCSGSCKILHELSSRLYERETVTLSNRQVVFKHDFTNKLYCINIYCTGNYFHDLL